MSIHAIPERTFHFWHDDIAATTTTITIIIPYRLSFQRQISQRALSSFLPHRLDPGGAPLAVAVAAYRSLFLIPNTTATSSLIASVFDVAPTVIKCPSSSFVVDTHDSDTSLRQQWKRLFSTPPGLGFLYHPHLCPIVVEAVDVGVGVVV